MKKALRILCAILAVALLIGTWPVLTLATDETSKRTEDGLFAYEILEDGSISITGSSATGDVVIPSQIGGRDVTNLAYQLFFGMDGIFSITIPATVTSFGGNGEPENEWAYCFSYCSDLQNISVDKNNPSFMSVDGVLYDKEQTLLYNYPCAKEGGVYHVPETVRDLACTSFAACQNLKQLYLDGKDTWWYTYTFYQTPNLTVYYLADGSAASKALMDERDGRAGKNGYATFEMLTDEELSLDAEYHTQGEIRSFMAKHPFANAPADYETVPSVEAPYSAGSLTAETLEAALNALNFVRYTAGLNADVTLNDSYIEKAQTGTLVNAANDEMSHFPAKPAGMDDSLYELGYSGTSSSNLAWGYSTLVDALLYGWMSDADASNIDRVGHRRWVLNPAMKETGFGQVNSFTAMYALDFGGPDDPMKVAWPAQNTPVEYFLPEDPWSISLGYEVAENEVDVVLVRVRDMKIWYLNYQKPNKEIYGYFKVDNGGYGQPGCIIFRPNDIDEYSDQDRYKVTVSVKGETVAEYFVNFFQLYFNDVKNSKAWYSQTVYDIAGTMNANGKPLMSGYANGSGNFGPADPLTRQDFAVILYRLANEPDFEDMGNPFTDTSRFGYYYDCVCWAKASNVIAGYNDGRFGVGDKITREQVATILYRFAKDYMGINTQPAYDKGNLKKFVDGTAVSSWAVEALTWATGAGIITGKSNGTKLDARGNAARAEIGAMILRFIDYTYQKAETN